MKRRLSAWGASTLVALSVMAVELFGASVLPHAAIVCVVAYLLPGTRSIYPSQRLVSSNPGRPLSALMQIRHMHPESPPSAGAAPGSDAGKHAP